MKDIEAIFREIEGVPDFSGHHISSVTYQNGYGDMPLHVVAGWGDCEAIRTLVLAGADINAPGEHGYTPLHSAVEQGHAAAVKLLIELGAQFSQTDEGLTPLELAEALEDKEIVDVLRESI